MGVVLVLVVLLSAYMCPLELRPTEVCAGQGMVVAGMNGDEAQCRRPQTRVDACEVEAGALSAAAREGYSTGGRNTLLFFGYVAFIVPGIIFHIVFNAERSGIEEDKDRDLKSRIASCGVAIEQSGPPGM